MPSEKYYLDKIKRSLNSDLIGIKGGVETLTVTGSITTLTPPTNAVYCTIQLESSITSGVACRAWQTGDTPTTTTGMPKTNLAIWDITGAQNMTQFKITQATAGTHTLQIEYFCTNYTGTGN